MSPLLPRRFIIPQANPPNEVREEEWKYSIEAVMYYLNELKTRTIVNCGVARLYLELAKIKGILEGVDGECFSTKTPAGVALYTTFVITLIEYTIIRYDPYHSIDHDSVCKKALQILQMEDVAGVSFFFRYLSHHEETYPVHLAILMVHSVLCLLDADLSLGHSPPNDIIIH